MSEQILNDVLSSLKVISIPTRTKFRGITLREIALFEGPSGWAEFSPFLEYDENESLPWLMSGIEAAFARPLPMLRKEIPINATMPEVDDRAEIEKILSWYPGATTVKIKVGTDLTRDLARIAWVKALSPHSHIRLDVNGSWSVDHACNAINAIYEIIGNSFQYVEQPCSTIEELRKLKSALKVPVKIAGDEVFRKVRDPFAVDISDALDIMILKVAPLGGIRRSLKLAEHHKLPTVVSSALESAIGLSYELKLAATLPELNYACGLGTGSLLQFDVADVTIVNGHITVESLIPDQNALETLRASDERFSWWQDRIRKTWSAGAEQWIEGESENWK